MSEKKEIEINEEIKSKKENHHENDGVKSKRLAENSDGSEISESAKKTSKPKKITAWIITAAIVGLIGIFGFGWVATRKNAAPETAETAEKKEENQPGTEENHDEKGKEIKLNAESISSAGIQIEGVTQRPAVARLYVTGAVELNPEKTEMATPLVGGRIENVYAGVGDYVEKGSILAVISSPQLAQMHGKMHEAKTKYELAVRNLERAQKSENRVAVLQAKAKLDETEAALRRTKRLIELGAGAGKDLIAAETAYKTAKADYDFQSNISLNKEIQEAKAEVETSRVDLRHIQDELNSLGVNVSLNESDNHNQNSALVAVRSPLSGIVTERKFNSGAGIEAAVPIFAVSNLSTVYVIANVPEANLAKLSVGSTAEIKSASIGTTNGCISYIDPRLDETTRTGRVRLEVSNSDGRLRAGMFTEVGFYAGTSDKGGEELAVKSEAVQREGDKTIVFIPKENEAGAFEVREIEIGGEFEGYTAVKSGLLIGDKVVTKGSLVLKTQMQKGEMGDHGH